MARELGVKGVCCGQQFAEWFTAHNVGSAGRVEPIGRIRLTTLELKDVKRSQIILNILAHPAIEARLIDAMTLLNRLNPRVFLVLLYALRHGPARSAIEAAHWRICAAPRVQSHT